MKKYRGSPLALFIFLGILLSESVWGNTLQFRAGDEISVFSDKAYRRDAGRLFEAVGNVVISHHNDTLYGESASLNIETGELLVEGNVRYITENMTLYGSKIFYNIKDKKLKVHNARVISSGYYVVSKLISREKKDLYNATEAEYTTCRDCPESWSVFGQDVELTPKQYIRIKHALVKINGVVVLYLPYVIFPIKKERESGLLFPKFSTSFSEGVSYQQPWFWAIADDKDATVTPAFFGKRGMGSELQYRQIFTPDSWFEFNSLSLMDKEYSPYSDFNDHSFYRAYLNYEHNWQADNNNQHHLKMSYLRDNDILNDFSDFTDEYQRNASVGLSAFWDRRFENFDFSFRTSYQKNTLQEETLSFDDKYVQTVPQFSFSVMPTSLLRSKSFGMKRLSFGMELEGSSFRQNHQEEDLYLRNAHRTHIAPYLNWDIGYLGPIHIQSQAEFAHQKYWFRDSKEDSMEKYGTTLTTELKLELEKVIGLSYREKIEFERIPEEEKKKIKEAALKSEEELKYQEHLIGKLADIEKNQEIEGVVKERFGYKHAQELKLLHHYTTVEKIFGNKKFAEQIESSQGWFDYKDAVKTKEHLAGDVSSSTNIPVLNTLEFQWNNSVIKKTSRGQNSFADNTTLRDNFIYSKVAHFDLSQGIELRSSDSQEEDWQDRLTRLKVETGFSIMDVGIFLREYYFHQTSSHIMDLVFRYTHQLGYLSLTHRWNDSVSPNQKDLILKSETRVFPSILFGYNLDYDLLEKRQTAARYSALYSPANNCWQLELNYRQDLVDNQFSFAFLVNFSDNRFTGVSR